MSPDFFPSLFSNAWSIFLIVVFFGGSIFVHELGHFLAARRRGVHVARFSIGFGPAIWSRVGRDGVEYRLSWIPFGGYVALPQLADLSGIEGESNVNVHRLPPVSYATRMIVFVMGAAFNVLFAFVLACIVWVVGQPTFAELETNRIGLVVPTIKLPDGSVVTSPAADAHLRPGDVLLAVDGKFVPSFEEFYHELFLGSVRTEQGQPKAVLTISREGRPSQFVVYPRLVGSEKFREIGIIPAEDVTVELVRPGSPAAAAGLRSDDVITSVDGVPVYHRSTIVEHVARNRTRPIAFSLRRGADLVIVALQPVEETDAKTGKKVARVGIQFRDNIVIQHPNPYEQFELNVRRIIATLAALINPNTDFGPSKLRGPIGIAEVYHTAAQWDLRKVLQIAVLVNVNLAFLNLLPIPVLDGGQMLFATIGRLRRRDLSFNFVAATQSVFVVLIFSFIIYVSCFDVLRIARNVQANHAETATAATPPPAKAGK
ncbi:MAG: RIP metalloprotease RseP [Opitutaceae bacterium]|nr:RIP metalloprotease RseP [Opitutaceae bacterium]